MRNRATATCPKADNVASKFCGLPVRAWPARQDVRGRGNWRCDNVVWGHKEKGEQPSLPPWPFDKFGRSELVVHTKLDGMDRGLDIDASRDGRRAAALVVEEVADILKLVSPI